MRFSYPAEIEEQKDGMFLVRFPDVPEALTEGETREEALHEARDALTAALAGYVHARRDIPAPSPCRAGQVLVHLSPLIASKLALYEQMRREHITNAELGRRLGVTENAVRRLIDPDHRSHIGKVEAALDATGVHLSVEALAA